MHQWEVGCAATCLSVCSARPPRNKTFVYVKCSGKKHQDKLVFCEGANNGRAGWFSQRHLTQRHNTHPPSQAPPPDPSQGVRVAPRGVLASVSLPLLLHKGTKTGRGAAADLLQSPAASEKIYCIGINRHSREFCVEKILF